MSATAILQHLAEQNLQDDVTQSTAAPKAIDRLANRLGISAVAMRKATSSTACNYRVYWQQKGRKRRLIEAPKPILKHIQRTLLDTVFSHEKPSTWSHGFCPGRSIFTHAVNHRARDIVVTMDTKDFFPSIDTGKISPILRRFFPDELELQTVMQLVTRNGRLPQGAPTSPHLANLAFSPVDEVIARAIGVDWTYSRYADDLAFSGNLSVDALIALISDIILNHGFKVAPKKTRIMRQSHRQKITGLVVNHELNLPKEKRRIWRATLHRIRTQGLAAAKPNCLLTLNGFAAFQKSLVRFKEEHP